MSIHISKLAQDEQIFQRMTIGGTYEPIAITRLIKYCEKTNHETQMVPVERETASRFIAMRGVEQKRILAMPPEVFLMKPMLWVEDMRTLSSNGGFHDCWDGHHRYVRLFLEGYDKARAWVVKPMIWKQYIIDGLPVKTAEEILRMKSRI